MMGNFYSNYFETSPIIKDQKAGNGPLGLGDPEDKSLRPYELNISIPNIMTHTINNVLCKNYFDELDLCCEDSVFPTYFCRDEMKRLKHCKKTQETEELRQHCTDEYLRYRSEYRKTGRRRLFNALHGEDTFPSFVGN